MAMVSLTTVARPSSSCSSAKLRKADSPPDSCATLASSQTSLCYEDGEDRKFHQMESTDFDDEEVQRLQQSGDLRQIVGSQSMLSQELLRPSQMDYDYGDENVVEKARSSLLSGLDGPYLKDKPVCQISQAKHDFTSDISSGRTSKDDIASVLLLLPNSQPDGNYDEGIVDLDAMKDAAHNGQSKGMPVNDEQDSPSVERIITMKVGGANSREEEDPPLSQTSFGSLLDAIQIVNEQDQHDVIEGADSTNQTECSVYNTRPKRRRMAPKDKHLESSVDFQVPATSPRKRSKLVESRKVQLPMTNRKRSSPSKAISTLPTSITPRSRIEVAKYVFPQGKPESFQQLSDESSKKTTKSSTSSISVHVQDAAELATKIIDDSELAKELLLSMALCRTNPRTPPETIPGPGHVLTDGFFWSRYPPLESVLKDYMPEYYRLSIEKCQSCQQQAFNNRLVDKITATASERGWKFDTGHFSDVKVLRDRIRCYYKTHIQNAKKRLKTMLRNPTKRSNAIHLKEHFDLIQQAAQKKLDTDEVYA